MSSVPQIFVIVFSSNKLLRKGPVKQCVNAVLSNFRSAICFRFFNKIGLKLTFSISSLDLASRKSIPKVTLTFSPCFDFSIARITGIIVQLYKSLNAVALISNVGFPWSSNFANIFSISNRLDNNQLLMYFVPKFDAAVFKP